MNIAYIGYPEFDMDCKWINHFAELYKVIVFTSSIQENYPFLSKKVKVYNDVIPAEYPLLSFRKKHIIKRFKQIIKDENIYLIHSLYAFPNSFWSSDINFDKHIITTRGSDILIDYMNLSNADSFKRKCVNLFLKKKFELSLQKASFITSTSGKQQNIIKEIIPKEKWNKLILLRTGIPVDKFEGYFINTEIIAKEKDEIVIFSPRSMKSIYNLDEIIKSIKLLENLVPDYKVTLNMVSDFENSYYNDLKNVVNELGLNKRVNFLGEIKPKDMAFHYLNCDFVVMLPSSDGTPNSALEAMLAKKVLIMGNAEYDKDIFNENTIWQLEANKGEYVANTIASILNNGKENALIKIENAYRVVKKYTNLTSSLKTLDSLYKTLI